MRYYMTTRSPGASLAAACGLVLLCALAAAPVAEAGRRCPSGLLCPDDGWWCCSPRRESCCKSAASGGPFGRRLRTIEMIPASDPLLPPTFNIWQGGELLHSTSNSAARHLSQDSQDSATSEAGDDQATTVQQGARLSARMASGTPGDRDDPAMTGDDSSLGQLRMNGTPTGRGVRPTRITVEGFYASRDLEVRPGVGGDIRMEGTTMPTIRPGPYTRQQALRDAGITLGDSQRQTRPLKDQEKRQGK